ncbi:MAG: magnesium transporter [Cyclobacteriaceae bacterium]|nr:magnesium transporter [Cyclobacteriaceae bacterium]
MEEDVQFELTKEFLEKFRQGIVSQNTDFIISSLENIPAADITLLLHNFNADESKYVIDQLDVVIGAEIIIDLDEDVRERFISEFSSSEIAKFVNTLDSDDAVDLLSGLPLKEREEVLAEIDDSEKEAHILDLLRYDDDSAGGLMAKELIKANVNWNVVQCIEEIRRQGEKVSKIHAVYVVDNNDTLLGRVSLRRIILSEDNVKIADIYEDNVVSVETFVDDEEVASMMQRYNLEAVPVVNVHGKLLGRITIDDIVDVITETAEEERQLMTGISADVEEKDSVWMLTKARLPWLVIGIVGGLVSAEFIKFFEEDLARIVAIAFFIPLIQATGGNVGIQSSSIVVQSLASPSVFEHGMTKRLFKVLLVSLLNGVVLALLVFGSNLLFGGTANLSIVVSIALFSVVVIASLVGTITPLILDKFEINPALASGPFITTTNDIIGLAIYFFVIHLLL